MVCIYCGHKTAVTNSRAQKRSQSTWRRRHCSSCGAIFTTIEQADLGSSATFSDQKGQLHPFDRQKLFLSLYDSLRHRPQPQSDAEALTTTVIAKVLPKSEQAQVQRNDLVKVVYEVLRRFDNASYVQYKAFHAAHGILGSGI